MDERPVADKWFEVTLKSGTTIDFYGASLTFRPRRGGIPAGLEYASGDGSRRLMYVDPDDVAAIVVVDDGSGDTTPDATGAGV